MAQSFHILGNLITTGGLGNAVDVARHGVGFEAAFLRNSGGAEAKIEPLGHWQLAEIAEDL